jgi:hypothetical protein
MEMAATEEPLTCTPRKNDTVPPKLLGAAISELCKLVDDTQVDDTQVQVSTQVQDP